MNEVREALDIGCVNESPGVAKGIDAKFRIAELLDLEINCVNMFKKRVGIETYQSFLVANAPNLSISFANTL